MFWRLLEAEVEPHKQRENYCSIGGFASDICGLAEEVEMPSAVFRTIRMIEDAQLHYCIERTRPDSIRLSVTMVGQRLEIDIFEDDHIEMCRFQGDESVEGGWEALKKLLNTD